MSTSTYLSNSRCSAGPQGVKLKDNDTTRCAASGPKRAPGGELKNMALARVFSDGDVFT